MPFDSLLGDRDNVHDDLAARRHAVACALSLGSQSRTSETDDVGALRRAVDALSQRVDELARELDAVRAARRPHVTGGLPIVAPVDEASISRVSVPPVTPAKLGNRAFDVLLGAVADVPASRR